MKNVLRSVVACVACVWMCGSLACAEQTKVRVCAFNVHDLKAQEVHNDESGRVARLADVIKAIDADIVLLSEVDTPPSMTMDVKPTVGEMFVLKYLVPLGMRYKAYQIPTNTGEHSGMDLDNNGIVDPKSNGREYAGDCYGYGEYPGQYGMVLLVRDTCEALWREARTFKMFKWNAMPGALLPDGADGRPEWYDKQEAAVLRLSSKNHADIPVRVANGEVIHVLASHPTPPVFDGDEDRNGRRNHDEIRFWGDYISGEAYMTDDVGRRGGLHKGAHFVILGDLNADPASGDSLDNPIKTYLLDNPRIENSLAPVSGHEIDRLEASDTSRFRLRVDYVLASKTMEIMAQGVWRGVVDSPGSKAMQEDPMADFPSDHFPIWVDLAVEPGEQEAGAPE